MHDKMAEQRFDRIDGLNNFFTEIEPLLGSMQTLHVGINSP